MRRLSGSGISINQPDEEQRLVPRRSFYESRGGICQVILFVMIVAGCDFQFFGFSLITTQMKQLYGVSMTLNFWLSSAFLIVPLLFSVLGGVIASKLSIKLTLGLGLIFIIVGTWLKALINYSFLCTFIGQFVVAFSFIVLRVSVTKITGQWFDHQHRATATAFIMFTGFILTAASLFLPTLAINKDNIASHQVSHYRTRMGNFLLIFAVAISYLCVTPFLFYKQQPLHLPSPSSYISRYSVRESFTQIKKNTSLILLIMGGALSGGATVAYQIIVEAAFREYGASTMQIRWYSLISLPIIAIVTPLLSYYSGKKGVFKAYLVPIQIINLMCFIALLLFFNQKFAWLFGVILVITAVNLSSVASIGIEFLAELSFPVPEPLPVSIFFFAFKLSCLILVQLSSALIQHNHLFLLLLLFVILHSLATVLILLVKQKLNRREIDLNQSRNQARKSEETESQLKINQKF